MVTAVKVCRGWVSTAIAVSAVVYFLPGNDYFEGFMLPLTKVIWVGT
jgi:hypothetical protein